MAEELQVEEELQAQAQAVIEGLEVQLALGEDGLVEAVEKGLEAVGLSEEVEPMAPLKTPRLPFVRCSGYR